MMLDDEEIIPTISKGKGKAVETEPEDNLPWYVLMREELTICKGGKVSTSVPRRSCIAQ